MSDIGNYYYSYDNAHEFKTHGDPLMAAIEYWKCIQYAENGDFFEMPDLSMEVKAMLNLKILQARLPFAPLSKTMFLKGCHCRKALWLYKNKYDQRYVSFRMQQELDTSRVVRELAQQLFPSGTDVSVFPKLQHQLKVLQGKTPLQLPNLPYKLKQNLWLRQTKAAIKDGVKDIYEAAFTYKKVFAAVDILHAEGDGFVAYEVKSGFGVNDLYIHDCALKYYVMNHNIQLDDMFLMYLNEEYVNSLGISIDSLTVEDCDIQQLFIKKSILNEVVAMQSTIKKELKKIKPILSRKTEPKVDVGDQCIIPYACEFHHYCYDQYHQKTASE